MKWDQKMKCKKPLGIIGLLSGSVVLISITVVGDTFGLPGSAEYVTYERFNIYGSAAYVHRDCRIDPGRR